MWNTTPVCAGLVEVQPVPGDDVEQVVDGQRPQPVVLEMVGRDEVLRGAARR